MNFKYLIIEHEGMPVPVLFSTLIKHSEMRDRLGAPVFGAGHVKLWPDTELNDACAKPRIEVCGAAGSMDMMPRLEDAEIIVEDYIRLRGLAAVFRTDNKDHHQP